ncbi:MAG TPA: 23S rRNA (adenine(2503)-C(2))-methyltransferase RlmN [Gammaproteobacteria bacterium]|jgi:23S rRNA (adenine2503-C2)-methyltransferase|nr:23S rRNA (adenine(2503)-C(2))-methyltransferase RlmN [Gammaproteobacteria bacterium]
MEVDADRVNLFGLDRAGLEAFFLGQGEKPFRARQVLKWVYHAGVIDFDEMTDLSRAQRDRLKAMAVLSLPEVVERHESRDGTIKWAMRVSNGNCVETVLIPERGRNTLCVSSQVGCMLDCSFCSTGKQGFNGNLSAADIIGQLWLANRELAARGLAVTNVVLMGMGEPLLNFDNVLIATNLMMEDLAFGLSKRRVTVSTAGVVPGIRRLAEHTDVALAISLHAPNDALRDVLVPINRKYPIAMLLEACRDYLAGLGPHRSVTIEYTLLKGVNDTLDHARELAALLRDLRCKINLIPFNPFPASGYERPDMDGVRAFQTLLLNAGYATMLRTTRGDDIQAACGQLVGQVEDRTRRQARYIARVQAEAAA